LLALIDRVAAAEKAKADHLLEAQAARAEAQKARSELLEWKSRSWWRRALG
jgi:hypothetical protein